MLVCCREEVWRFEYVVVCWIELHFLHVWSKPSLSSTFMVWLFVVLGLSFVGEMYRGIGERRSLSEENLRVSVRPRRNNVTLDAHAVNVENGGAKVQVTGHRLQVTGHRLQVTGHRSQVTGHRSQVTGHRLQVTGHRSKK